MKYCYYIITFLLTSIFIQANISWSQSGWAALSSGTAHSLKAVYPLDYNTIFVAGEGARVLKSTDAGNSWQDISPAFASVNFNDVVFFDSLNGLVVGSTGTILRTTDGGASWAPVASGVADNLYSITFFDSVGICGAQSQTILTSSDRGNSWVIAQSGFFGGGFWGTCMLSPQIGYVIGENSIFQPLLGRTIDGGQNWNFVSFYLAGNEGRANNVQFTDINIGYATCRVWDGRGAIAKTTDGGSNWNSTFFSNPLHGISFPISGASLVGYAVGEMGSIIKTIDAGNSWQAQVSGAGQRLNDVAFLDMDYGFAVGDGGTILKTESGGEPPILVQPSDDEGISGFRLIGNYPNPFNPKTIISWQLAIGSFVYLSVYNSAGQSVAILVNERQPAGYHSIGFDGSRLSSGVYLYRLGIGTYTETRKMVLLK